MRHASGPAQPTLFTADACASVRRDDRNGYPELEPFEKRHPSLCSYYRNQKYRVKRRLERWPDAPRTRAAYDREYEFVEAETSEPLARRGRA